MKRITSRTNPEIKAVAALSSAKERHRQQRFIAEGLRTVQTMIQAGMEPLCIYVTQQWINTFATTDLAQIVVEVSQEVMEKISQSESPSGILAVFPLIKRPLQNLTPGIVLAHVADPGNLGTLIRTCAAMGQKTVCCVGTVDPWNPKVIQATAGTIAQVNIIQGEWHEVVKQSPHLKKCALVVSDGTVPVKSTENNILLIIGNEASGIPQEWLPECDELYTLAMPGKTESLNAAIAGSIAMYLMWS